MSYVSSYVNVVDVWGFDEEHVEVLKGMKPPDTDQLINKYAILLEPNSPLLPENASKNKKVSNNSITTL